VVSVIFLERAFQVSSVDNFAVGVMRVERSNNPAYRGIAPRAQFRGKVPRFPGCFFPSLLVSFCTSVVK
jgi:hypothetical protein